MTDTGLLVALEGIDGAGTTTQRPRIARFLEGLGHHVLQTAEPSQGPVGRLLRQMLQGEQSLCERGWALLFAADRRDHLQRQVLPHLRQGGTVITDRYVLSSYAYQGRHLPLAWVGELNTDVRIPDVCFYLRVSSETAAKRRQARGGLSERFDDQALLRQVANTYEQALHMPHVGPVHVVDAEQSVAEVTSQIVNILRTALVART